MSPEESAGLCALLAAAHPVLRITAIERCDWRRVMSNPKDKRIGPWKYRAHFDVLDENRWGNAGEVLYLVTDAAGGLRLVGQSKDKLKTRWRTSPMFHVDTLEPLGTHALFHTSSWPAIEKGFEGADDKPPFTVSALFRDELEAVCRAHPVFAPVRAQPETHLQRLSLHVESWVCALRHPRPLWNKAKVAR